MVGKVSKELAVEALHYLSLAALILALIFSRYPALNPLLPKYVFAIIAIIFVLIETSPALQTHRKSIPRILLEYYKKKASLQQMDINSPEIIGQLKLRRIKAEETENGIFVPVADDLKKFEKIKIPVALLCFLVAAKIFYPLMSSAQNDLVPVGTVFLVFVWISAGTTFSVGVYYAIARYVTKHQKLMDYRTDCLTLYGPTLSSLYGERYAANVIGGGKLLAVEFEKMKNVVFSYMYGVVWRGGRWTYLRGYQLNLLAPQSNPAPSGAIWVDGWAYEKKANERYKQLIKSGTPDDSVYSEYEWKTNMESMANLCAWLNEKSRNMGFMLLTGIRSMDMLNSIQFKGDFVYLCITTSSRDMERPTKFAMELIEKLRADGLIS